MKISPIAAAIAVLLVSGCTADKVDVTAAGPDKDGSLFVIGLAPENTQVQIAAGSMEHGTFYRGQRYQLYQATDGFIIGHIAQGEVLGVSEIRYYDPGTHPLLAALDIPGPNAHIFRACNSGSRTLTFSTPAGKVLYLASITAAPNGDTNGLDIVIKRDLAGAQNFMKAHYPQLADKLEQGSVQRPEAGECNGG
ncbi:MAG TPA: hypothetical protein VHZ29_18535 [Rhizomicrobium sp.]|jgi:hypothetical protein|nr:hypothetical protein [Rhizomicrobium sp.]